MRYLPLGEPIPPAVEELTELGYALADAIEMLDRHEVPTRLAAAAFDDTRRSAMNSLTWVCAELRSWTYVPADDDWGRRVNEAVAALQTYRSARPRRSSAS